MLFVVIAFVVSFLVTVCAIRLNLGNPVSHRRFATQRRAWVRQPNLRGLTRSGGIGIALGLGISFFSRLLDSGPLAAGAAHLGLLLLASSLPVFVAGLTEDFIQGLRIWIRFSASLASAAVAGFLLDAWVLRTDIAWGDAMLGYPAVAVFFTCLAVAGLTNAFNIIDGFNGLASGVATLILLGITYIAFKVGDVAILAAALTSIGAIAGFMLLNFPRGLIYLGDGGAYLVGFWIAELLVLLVARNPAVSPWFPILVCCYPIFETLFSIYRRVFLKRIHPGVPDVAHLHHLIYKRLVRWLVGTNLSAHRTQRNALTSPYLWVLTSTCVVPAVLFWKNSEVLMFGAVLFAAGYIFGYSRIARFRAPGWWVLRKRSGRGEGK